MNHVHPDLVYSTVLLLATLWTTLFSLTIHPGIRGYRNLGILACYVLLPVMLLRLPFQSAVLTWCAFGVGAGLLYMASDLIERKQISDPAEREPISWSHLVYGQIAWPIMAPEAIENLLAQLGVLRCPSSPDVPPPDAPLK